jgi:uncharacterized membrane protein YbhN (UPF0104 family)
MSLVGILTSALGLYVAFRRVHWLDVRAALAAAEWPWLVVFALLNASTMLTRAVQLMALARKQNGARPALGACYRAVTVGMLAQTILPARLGEAARVVAIVKDGDVPAPHAVGAIALGRVLDLVALLLTTCVPPLVLGLAAAAAGAVRAATKIGSIVAIALLVGLSLFYRRREPIARAADGLRPWLGRWVGGLAEGLSALGSPRRLVTLAVSTAIIPLTVAASYGAAANAFGISLPAGGALVMVAAVFLAIAVPSAPSAVGVYHAVAGWVLLKFGVAPATAAAFTVSTHAIGVVEFVILGGISFVQLGGPWKREAASSSA